MTGRQRMIVAWSALLIGWLAVFAIMETYALMQSNPEDAITLSRFVVELSRAWPPLIFILGFVSGLLTAHFWWPWNPDDPRDRRG